MIRIENIDIHGITRAVYSARNAMNSWDKSDSDLNTDILGDADLTLAKKLAKAGTDHRKFMRMITVYADITAPLYWWKEYDTYKVGTVANSCSTMHKIHGKEFTMDDFSHEHLFETCCVDDETSTCGTGELDQDIDSMYLFRHGMIPLLNFYRKKYIETQNKDYWWQMIQLLPSAYNQKRTVMMSYETVFKIIKERSGHKLDEWNEFVAILKQLPYVKEIMQDEKND